MARGQVGGERWTEDEHAVSRGPRRVDLVYASAVYGEVESRGVRGGARESEMSKGVE